MPERKECEEYLYDKLNGPNVDLLNDWIFCHNHDHSTEHSSQESNGQLEIPEDAQKPVVLDQIEQIVYVLTCDSNKVLFESTENKDYSIYLELIDE